jgi:hypothetical protein
MDQYWHYLIFYKLIFNLLINNIQLHALIKHTMFITYLLEFLILIKNEIKFIKIFTIHNHGFIYIIYIIYILFFILFKINMKILSILK